MANNTNPQDNLEYIQGLLSPYLDGKATDEERALVEQAIATSPELQQELESLRQTVALVRALPPMPAPRPFTLSEADVQSKESSPKKSFWLPRWAGGLALLAATLVCVLVAGAIFFSTQFGQSTLAPAELARLDEATASQAVEAEADEVAVEAAAEEAVEEEAEEARQEAIEVAPPRELKVEKEVESVESAELLAEEEVVTITKAEGEATGEVADDSAAIVGQSEITEKQEAVERDGGTGGIGGGEIPTEAIQATALPSPLPVPTTTPLPQPTSSPETPALAPPAPAEAAEGEAPTEAEEPVVAQAAPASEAGAAAPEEEALTDAEAPAAEPEDDQSQTFQEGTVRLTSTPTPLPSPTLTPQPTVAPPATPTPVAQVTSAPPSEPDRSSQDALPEFILAAILVVLLAALVIVGIVIWLVINKKS